MSKTLLVVGGGAAGFFCAVNAARLNPSLKVIIAEKTGKLLSKVKVSGGGRCNVTHNCPEVDELVKKYPRGKNFLKKAFHHFNTTHTINWFQERGIELKTEADGRMFPQTNSSQTIIDCLLKEADKYKVQVLLNCDIKDIIYSDNSFQITASNSNLSKADYVVIACGGFHKAEHYQWLLKLGHTIQSTVPSLFTFNIPNNNIKELMGLSVPHATVKVQGTKHVQTGPLLITHWGLSGPAILKTSAWAARDLADLNYDFAILVNWINSSLTEVQESFQRQRQLNPANKIGGKNSFDLPQRLWQYFLTTAGINPEKRWADLLSKEQNKLAEMLTAQMFAVKGKTTFKEEFVTCGGITLSEIEPQTMQSRKLANFFFAGEVMDVDGVTGGFNFQHAWTSGWLAANAIGTNSV